MAETRGVTEMAEIRGVTGKVETRGVTEMVAKFWKLKLAMFVSRG